MINVVIQRVKVIGVKKTIELILKRGIQSLLSLHKARLRYCRCCSRYSLYLCLGKDEEAIRCVYCGANIRYELLAHYIRTKLPFALKDAVVLEVDSGSPLSPLLNTAYVYFHTYFSIDCVHGSERGDGAICEDLTQLTFDDSSLDLIVSSDVLEHIPDIESAFRETERVLKPKGMHLFTVPTHLKTKKLAVEKNGKIIHLSEPEYHLDPLSEQGILALWHFGTSDIDRIFSTDNLQIKQLTKPEGNDRRVVWAAIKKINDRV